MEAENVTHLTGRNDGSAPTDLDCGSMDQDDLELWTSCQYWCEGILFSIIGGIGLFGNIVSIAILATKEMRKHSFNHLLIVLACYDSFFILTGVPVHVSPIFKLEGWLYSVLYPHFLYPFTSISFTGSIYMTLALTVERYIAVCRPHRYRDLNASMTTFCKVMIYALPVTTFSFLLNIPKFLETQVSYNNETGIEYNVTELRLNPTYIWWYTLSYICHPTLTTAIIPIIALIVLNFNIFKGIRRARTQVHSSHRHGEMNLAVVLVSICGVFLVCHLLRVYLALQAVVFVDMTVVCMREQGYWIPPSWLLCLESVSHLLVMVSSSTNFLIYCTISTKFKIFLKRTFLYRSAPHPESINFNSGVALQTINGMNMNLAQDQVTTVGVLTTPSSSFVNRIGDTRRAMTTEDEKMKRLQPRNPTSQPTPHPPIKKNIGRMETTFIETKLFNVEKSINQEEKKPLIKNNNIKLEDNPLNTVDKVHEEVRINQNGFVDNSDVKNLLLINNNANE